MGRSASRMVFGGMTREINCRMSLELILGNLAGSKGLWVRSIGSEGPAIFKVYLLRSLEILIALLNSGAARRWVNRLVAHTRYTHFLQYKEIYSLYFLSLFSCMFQ